jgi:hypothetical protein
MPGDKFASASDVDLAPNEAYAKWWREWYNFIKLGVQTTTFKFRLTAQDILGLNPEYKWKVKHHHYLWSEIKTTISNRHGIEHSEVDLLKVAYGADCNMSSDEIVSELQEEETVGDG